MDPNKIPCVVCGIYPCDHKVRDHLYQPSTAYINKLFDIPVIEDESLPVGTYGMMRSLAEDNKKAAQDNNTMETPRIPVVVQILEHIRTIHEAKNKDYASSADPFENFNRSASLMEWFNNSNDKAFVSLIGTKLARIATLRNTKKGPNNESLADSYLDLCTYCILWYSYYLTEASKAESDDKNPSPLKGEV